MASVIVVYDSKYGNTKLVAETIIEGMREVSGTEVVLVNVKEVDLNQIPRFGAILIGSPNHFGGATRVIRKFIDELGKLKLEGKRAAVFDICYGGEHEKAVRKMEQQIGQKAPGLRLMSPGLSIRVGGGKGPITEGELPKCKEFGRRIASLMKD